MRIDEPRRDGTARTYLMCPPAYFAVTYAINPWMRPYAWAENPVGHLAAARRSFQSFAAALTAAGARLEIMPGVAGLPDMVFPANAAVVLDRLGLAGGLCRRSADRPGWQDHQGHSGNHGGED